MRDYLELGPVPAGESCAQVGEPDFDKKAREECGRYRNQLEKMFPQAAFGVKGFPHDFGRYYEVVVYFDSDNERETEIAYMVEEELPEFWED